VRGVPIGQELSGRVAESKSRISKGKIMKLHEYIEKAKEELDTMLDKFVEENKLDPDSWPLEMTEEEWVEQELAERFY